MKRVWDIAVDVEFTFDESVPDAHCLCMCYASANNLLSSWFDFVQTGAGAAAWMEKNGLRITRGKKSMALGDFALLP
jgi:hypothetical protein